MGFKQRSVMPCYDILHAGTAIVAKIVFVEIAVALHSILQ